MTDTPKKLVVDIAAGTQMYIDLTTEEIAQRAADEDAHEIDRAARVAADEAFAALKASAKSKLIAGQPLTEEEAATIVI